MRCALKYDDELRFAEQKVSSWGELQSLAEEPSYKEAELSKGNAIAFMAYKMAMDDAIDNYEACSEADYDIDVFKRMCAGSICEMLFSILDEVEEGKDE